MITNNEFSQNLSVVTEAIEHACQKCGRSPNEVTLLPVTKNWPSDGVRMCKDAGINRVGENRVQEAMQKMDEVEDIDFDLIGHLQTNKAKLVVGRFSCLQSVDSVKLLEKLGRLAEEKCLVQKILLQINAGNDPSKFGISIKDSSLVVEKALGIPSLDTIGFMTIAPFDPENRGTAKQAFKNLRELRDRMAITFGKTFPELSMGMSGDLNEAIAEGSTMIRVGSALFGERKVSK